MDSQIDNARRFRLNIAASQSAAAPIVPEPEVEATSWLTANRCLFAFELAVAINVLGCVALVPDILERREHYVPQEQAADAGF